MHTTMAIRLMITTGSFRLLQELIKMQIYAYFQLPKKHAEAWEKSPMHISNITDRKVQ